MFVGLILDKRILTFFFLPVAASEIPSKPLPLVREQVTNLCINALFSYRKFCATVSSSGQLILPEALKLLPLYTLGMFLQMFYDEQFCVNIFVIVCSLFMCYVLPCIQTDCLYSIICFLFLFLLHHFCIYMLVTSD